MALPGAPIAHAQNAQPLVAVQGMAFDSLQLRPLQGATIRALGTEVTGTSDARGQFQLAGLSAGRYTFTLEHAALDSIGLPEIVLNAEITAQQRTVQLAIPSFATLWRGLCGDRVVPLDSALVYGIIQDAAAVAGIADARVAISWTDVGVTAAKKLKQTRFTLETRTDALGRYVACGVPADVPLVMAASTTDIPTAPQSIPPSDSVVADATLLVLELPARTTRIQRRDLLLATMRSSAPLSDATAAGARGTASTTTGTSAAGLPAGLPAVDSTTKQAPTSELLIPMGSAQGRLTTSDGAPVANARVLIDDVELARSDSTGNFTIPKVRAGTHTWKFIAIGNLPVTRVADGIAGQIVTVSAQLERVTTLERVDVKATVVSEIIREFEERKRMGFGYIRDSTELGRMGTLSAAMHSIPSAYVSGGGTTMPLVKFKTQVVRPEFCVANYFLNRVPVDAQVMSSIHLDDIAWMEVYPRWFTTPREFMINNRCGAVVVFTKQSMRR